MKLLSTILFTILCTLGSIPASWSQDSIFFNKSGADIPPVKKDPRIDGLIKKQIQINEETSRNARRTDKGYRLLIISTPLREDALAAKTKVYSYFPELKAYLFHQSPYYKVKAGNFKDRKEAELYQMRLDLLFPRGVFIINDIIEVKLKVPGEEENNL
jgi:SPOR domain